jgi:hypothetical protein
MVTRCEIECVTISVVVALLMVTLLVGMALTTEKSVKRRVERYNNNIATMHAPTLLPASAEPHTEPQTKPHKNPDTNPHIKPHTKRAMPGTVKGAPDGFVYFPISINSLPSHVYHVVLESYAARMAKALFLSRKGSSSASEEAVILLRGQGGYDKGEGKGYGVANGNTYNLEITQMHGAWMAHPDPHTTPLRPISSNDSNRYYRLWATLRIELTATPSRSKARSAKESVVVVNVDMIEGSVTSTSYVATNQKNKTK